MLRERALPGLTGRWNAPGSLHGARRATNAAVRDLKIALRGIGRLQFSSPAEGSGADVDVLRGIPSTQRLAISRWRLRGDHEGVCEDPTAEGCGLYWLGPGCPAQCMGAQRRASLIAGLL